MPNEISCVYKKPHYCRVYSSCARSSSFGTGEEQCHCHWHSSSPHLPWKLGHSVSILLGPLPLALWTTSFLLLHTGPSVVHSNEKFLIQPELMHYKVCQHSALPCCHYSIYTRIKQFRYNLTKKDG